MSTAVLSVRIRKKLKEEAEKLGIDVRSVVEKALEEEIRRVLMSRFRSIVKESLENMDVNVDEWVKCVKEIRRER